MSPACDTMGDLCEYMPSKIASAGQNGQFCPPRHVIQRMAAMIEATRSDVIRDPACGTCGSLVAAGEYMRDNDPKLFTDAKAREHFHNTMFLEHDFDNTMLGIGSMKMALHGIDERAAIQKAWQRLPTHIFEAFCDAAGLATDELTYELEFQSTTSHI